MGGTLGARSWPRSEALDGVVTINAQILDRGGLIVKLGPVIEKLMPIAPASAAGLTKNDIKKGGDEDAYDLGRGRGRQLAGARAARSARPAEEPDAVRCWSIYSRDDHSVPPANSKALPGLVGTPAPASPCSSCKTRITWPRSTTICR